MPTQAVVCHLDILASHNSNTIPSQSPLHDACDMLCSMQLPAWGWLVQLVVSMHQTVTAMQVRDQARRFITLIDELYNARVRLICSADSPPDLLFAGNLEEEPIIDLEQLQYEGAVEGALLWLPCNSASVWVVE